MKPLGFAIEIAQGHETILDYSHSLIQGVEQVFSKIHKDYKTTRDETGLNGAALEFAAYIVDTIMRNIK